MIPSLPRRYLIAFSHAILSLALLAISASSTKQIDSSFFVQNFVDHTYRAVISRKILPPAEGFHLEILTEVVLGSPLISNSASLNCTLRLTETLPSALYVDAFQLRNFHQFGGPRVTSDNVIDTEAPAFESRNERLLVHHPFQVDRQKQRLIARVVLPVHLRYHRAVDGGEPTKTEFFHPETHIACVNNQDTEREYDLWVPFEAEAQTPVISIPIPRGDIGVGPIVIVSTFFACSWASVQLWTAAPLRKLKQGD